MWHEAREDKYDYADNENRKSGTRTAFPLFEDNAPDVAKHDVESHKNAESKRRQDWRRGQEAFAKRKTKELAIP